MQTSQISLDESMRLIEEEANTPVLSLNSNLDEDLDLDYSTVTESKPFELLPAGKHLFKIVNAEPKLSKNGNRYLKVELVVRNGPYVNKHLWDNPMLEGDGMNRSLNLFSALGLYNKETKKVTGKVRDLIGKNIIAKVVHKEEKDENGDPVTKDRVAYAGYEPAPQDAPVAEPTEPPFE